MTDLQHDLQTALGENYTIERELGGGGMSRVFVATDRSLRREVVVKVLPPETAGQVSIERFRREIALAARLQHPHIVPLLSAGEAGGLPYFTMPYVKSESLRAKLAARGELPITEALRLLREIATALAFAHDAGVVHRDIKPDNVLLSGGSAMVTDFGVAKAIGASTTEGGSGLTSLGVALGTPAYMSPEQASADPTVDHRADIYAWGVLAYEMLTGSTPFAGRPSSSVLAAHVMETPEPIERRRAGLPPALASLVMRCLAKRPADRPQSTEELVHALDAITTPSGGLQPTSSFFLTRPRRAGVGIVVAAVAVLLAAAAGAWYAGRSRNRSSLDQPALAVLPFDAVGGDSSFDYVAEGLSDEVRSRLTETPGLRVKARASSVAFRGRRVDLADIGGKLGVNTVLEGSVRANADRLRVTAELVNVRDGNALWSHTFDAAAASLATVQDSIMRAIAGALRLRQATAGANEPGALRERGTTDADAYSLFLRGVYYLHRFAFRDAADYLNRAVARDPKFARAWASLAVTYSLMPQDGFASPDSTRPLALQYSTRALELDSTLVDAYNARGYALLEIFKLGGADSAFARALELDPRDANAMLGRAQVQMHRGDISASLTTVENARKSDPLSIDVLVLVQYELFSASRFREAIEATAPVLELDPNSSFGLQNLALAYAFLGKRDSALATIDREWQVDSTTFGGLESALLVYAAVGRWDRVGELQRRAAHDRGNSPHFARFSSHLVAGEFDAAAAEAADGIHAHEPLFGVVFVGCDPSFDPMKNVSRYVALMKEIGVTICPPLAPWPITPPR